MQFFDKIYIYSMIYLPQTYDFWVVVLLDNKQNQIITILRSEFYYSGCYIIMLYHLICWTITATAIAHLQKFNQYLI